MRTEWKPYRNVMLCDAEPAPRRLGPERSLVSGRPAFLLDSDITTSEIPGAVQIAPCTVY